VNLTARIGAGNSSAHPSWALARELIATGGGSLGSAPERVALSGTDETAVAVLALHLASRGHQVILAPAALARAADPPLGAAHHLNADGYGVTCRSSPYPQAPEGTWRIGLYSSGSSDSPRAYGFTLSQLEAVARWYEVIYGVTGASAIVTCLPVSYNFAFVAGLCLAAHTGALLTLSGSPDTVFRDAARLAREADRVVVLANPVLLDLAGRAGPRLPGNVLIDSGGAPLCASGIALLRERLGDVREGYGLTETASLTHFDAEGTSASLGTVGAAMPGVRCWIADSDGLPRLGLRSPSTGVELSADGSSGPERSVLLTDDLGTIDPARRLRLLGRADDCTISGLWPRDTLDLIGAQLATRCALVRHANPGLIQVRVLGGLQPELAAAIHAQIRDRTGLPATGISVTGENGRLLHSQKMPRTSSRITP
jgi:hypothetical protein